MHGNEAKATKQKYIDAKWNVLKWPSNHYTEMHQIILETTQFAIQKSQYKVFSLVIRYIMLQYPSGQTALYP